MRASCGEIPLGSKALRATVIALTWAVPAVALAQDIHLACEGTATGRRDEPIAASGFDNETGQTFSVSGSTRRTVSEADEILIDITGVSGRIKLPGRLTPVLHTHADDGWRTFSSLTVGDTEIKGRFDLNFANRPSLVINRMTGHIDLVGRAGTFAGQCQPYQPDVAARRF